MENKIQKYYKIKEQRRDLESLWEECYNYTFPSQNVFASCARKDNLFDSTASDCVDQLASHLLSEMTPPYSSWFQLHSNYETKDRKSKRLAEITLHETQEKIYAHLGRSNFFSTIHQCYIDLCVIGTACLLFEEAQLGQNSAFNFKAISMRDIYIDENNSTHPETIYKKSQMGLAAIKEKFSNFIPTKQMEDVQKNDSDFKLNIVECVYKQNNEFKYFIFTENDNQVLASGTFEQNPFIIFRFTKSPSVFYGRSPIMKALPDIKTANKIVELVLKNASLAVSGVWQADDDGVLNPANIELTPGAIIPKAMGSSGLTPLKVGTDFNISDLILKDIRENIKSALLSTQLQPFNQNFNMSATEVLQRSSISLKVLGATYGRLQSELLNPLILRAYSILKRRGEIKDPYSKSDIQINYVSKLGQLKSYDDVSNILDWIKMVSALGQTFEKMIDKEEILQSITKKMNISKSFLLTKDEEYENKVLEFVHKMPANLIDGLINLDDKVLAENLENYKEWMIQKTQKQMEGANV